MQTYVKHPALLPPYDIRWISRTGNEDSMGMIFPATAEHIGYRYAKENGQMRTLPPEGKISFSVGFGFLSENEAYPV